MIVVDTSRLSTTWQISNNIKYSTYINLVNKPPFF